MRISFPRVLTALIFGAICATTAWGDDTLDCRKLFESIPASRKLAASKAARARLEMAEAKATDPRLAMFRLTDASPTLNRLDNFSSPALLTTNVLDRQKARGFVAHLAGVVAKSHSISAALRDQGHLPSHVEVLFDLIETRFRVATEIVGLARAMKTGSGESPDVSFYAGALLETAASVVRELREDRTFGFVFSDFDFEVVDWVTVTRRVEASVRTDPLFAYRDARHESLFLPAFVESIGVESSIASNVERAGSVLEELLSATPVGIYHRLADLTSAIRFGPFLFFGNVGDYRRTTRDKYIATRTGQSSTTEVTLRMSPRRKKWMALLLDRSHQDLDPLFGLEQARGRHFNTCGSYVPSLLTRCGVPLIAPAYLTPGALAFSLALQKHLPFGPVEDAKITYAKEFVDIPEDLVTVAYHEFFPTGVEFAAYLGLGYGLERLLSLLL